VLGCLAAGVSAGGAPGTGGGNIAIGDIDWDRCFALCCANLGWGWEQAERELDLHRLATLNRLWADEPPVHRLLAGFVGYKPPRTRQHADDAAGIWGALASGIQPVRVPALDTSAWDSESSSTHLP